MNLSPVARITLGLVLLTIGILLAGSFIGLAPDNTRSTLEARQRFCEALAVQSSLALRENNIKMVENTIEMVVARNADIRSAALRRSDETLLVATPGHESNWQHSTSGLSTMTQVEVPIFRNNARWGTVEISFTPPAGSSGWLGGTFAQLLLFVAVTGFIVYYLLIRKVLKHLDPSAVIPGRVKAALDVLAEGVVLIDDRGNIVLANTAFSTKIGATEQSLLGMPLSQLKWVQPGNTDRSQPAPWELTIREGKNQTGVPMTLNTQHSGQRILMVNSAPILDGKGKPRGALTTFDDVTQLEEKNTQLEEMLQLLQDSQDKVNEQNRDLKILASHDSLTDCLNRRALFETIDREIGNARRLGTPLSCVMCDIDYFKRINDTHGHITGDHVIRKTAEILRSLVRDSDAVGRYGGEEFCILLPGMPLEKARDIAERFRARIDSLDIDGIHFTASFGVARFDPDSDDAEQLLKQADEALYKAKESGRNQVAVTDGKQAA